MSLGRSVRYLFAIPSNVLMIVGSSLGYFYFAGLQTFALLFVLGHFKAGQAEGELFLALLVVGAVIGTLVGGRVPDLLLKRGYLSARVWFPGVCYAGAAVLLIPGFLGKSITPAIWFAVLGAGLISAANPPLQAARLDVVPAGLWGRAQSAQAVVRSLAQAFAPLVFGGISQLISGIVPSQAPIGDVKTHLHAPLLEHHHRAPGHLPRDADNARRRRLLPIPRPGDVCVRCRQRGRVRRADETGRRDRRGGGVVGFRGSFRKRTADRERTARGDRTAHRERTAHGDRTARGLTA